MRNRLFNFWAALPLFAMCFLVTPARADTITINFDTDASGNPISGPNAFADTSALTNEYASLGVTFSGPASGQGGAIVNDSSWSIPAHSRPNLLGFNSFAGYPIFPETLSFSTLVSHVQIYASGADDTGTFVMQAFDNGGTLVDSDTISTRPFALLQVDYAPGIRRVVINRTESEGASELDDLTFVTTASTPVPEPASLMLFGAMAAAAAGFAWRKRRRQLA